MHPILPLIALGLLLLFLFAIFIWPQIGMAFQMVCVVFIAMIVSFFGFRAGISYTLLFTLIFGVIIFLLKRHVNFFKFSPQELLIMAFAVLLWFSLYYTSTPSYGSDKAKLFVAVCVSLVIAGRVFGSKPEYMIETLTVFSWMCTAILCLYIGVFIFARDTFTGASGRYAGGIDDLILSWTAATAIVMASYNLIKRSSIFLKIFTAVVILGGFVVIVATGSRGPFIGLLIGGILTFLGRRGIFKSLLFLGLIAIISYTALFYLAPEAGRERVVSLFEKGALEKTGRIQLYRMGFEQYLHHPVLGGGAGSFANFRGRGDSRSYPHNIFIEVLAETGTVGFVIIAFVFLLCIKPMLILRSKEQPLIAEAKIIQWLFWVGLANAMLSFDIPEQRALFASIGFLSAVRQWQEMNNQFIASDIYLRQEEYINQISD